MTEPSLSVPTRTVVSSEHRLSAKGYKIPVHGARKEGAVTASCIMATYSINTVVYWRKGEHPLCCNYNVVKGCTVFNFLAKLTCFYHVEHQSC